MTNDLKREIASMVHGEIELFEDLNFFPEHMWEQIEEVEVNSVTEFVTQIRVKPKKGNVRYFTVQVRESV